MFTINLLFLLSFLFTPFLYYMSFFLPRLILFITMFKSKIGTSVQPTVSPDLKGKRINTTGKQLQTSTKPAPRKSMDVLNDPIYRLYVNMMAEFGLLDPYLSYEEVEYKVDTLSRVIREHNLVRERFGPPPVDKGVAAMTVGLNSFLVVHPLHAR